MKVALLVVMSLLSFSAVAERAVISKARPLIDQFNFEARENGDVTSACVTGKQITSLYQPEIDAAVADGSMMAPQNREDMVHMQMTDLIIAKICKLPEPTLYQLSQIKN